MDLRPTRDAELLGLPTSGAAFGPSLTPVVAVFGPRHHRGPVRPAGGHRHELTYTLHADRAFQVLQSRLEVTEQPLQVRNAATAADKAEVEVVRVVGQRDVERLAVERD